MNQTDKIREYIVKAFVEPARRHGRKQVTIRAGDVHKDLRLSSRMPMVCSALDGRKLQDLAGVSVLRRTGPAQGANVYVTFALDGKVSDVLEDAMVTPDPSQPTSPSTLDLDPSSTLILVSCVKSKRPTASKARDLYVSALFEGYKSLVAATGADWLILSAKYGLVEPDAVLEPYEKTLNKMGVADRRQWAAEVMEVLLPIAQKYEKVVFLAGMRYREFLTQPLLDAGLQVETPMEGLSLGKQLSWLSTAA